jgi:hypothetical protein
VDFSPDSWECFFTAQDMVGMSSMCFGQQAACKLIEPAGLRGLVGFASNMYCAAKLWSW